MKKKLSKNATIIALSNADMHQILTWLKLNKALKSVGKIKEVDRGYAVKVKSKISKSSLNSLAKERFGVFVKVI
jgi:hypothetical protein